MEIKPKFKIGQIVYIKTDPELLPRQVLGYHIRQRTILYEVQLSNEVMSAHYDFELSSEKYMVDLQN